MLAITFGPTVRITRSESAGSPASSRTTLVSAAMWKSSRRWRARARMSQGLGRRHAAGRDGEDQAIAELAGQLHGARAETRDVEGNARLETHVLLLADEHLDRPSESVARVVHRLPAEEAPHHPQMLGVFGDAHGRP